MRGFLTFCFAITVSILPAMLIMTPLSHGLDGTHRGGRYDGPPKRFDPISMVLT